MKLSIVNETSELQSVVLGIAREMGKARIEEINPTMRKYLKENSYPRESDIGSEIDALENIFIKNGIDVFRPSNILNKGQLFTRDIGFVIEDYFFISNMRNKSRMIEINGLAHILSEIEKDKIIKIPKEITIEGGNVILWNQYIFLGVGPRTSKNAINFLQSFFPEKTVLGFELNSDSISIDKNILHLDCTFQPIGLDEAIIYHGGFKKYPNELSDLFSKNKLIEVTLEEKNLMYPNVFSLSHSKIIIERKFKRLKKTLTERGYEIIDVNYFETSKLGGLLRCSTLPLKRK
ncbi:MAG: dimethylarginine dimethylaminohydrolase family protein [Saprospiraceae bacterium]